MDSSPPLWTTRPTPHRVSQDPVLLCRHAPSPLTPGSPMRASAHCFRIDGRLQHLRKIGRCHWFHEAESGSQSLGSCLRSRRLRRLARPHARPNRSVSRRQLPSDAGPELHAERATRMADTSQSARAIWVTLAQPKKRSERRRNEENREVSHRLRAASGPPADGRLTARVPDRRRKPIDITPACASATRYLWPPARSAGRWQPTQPHSFDLPEAPPFLRYLAAQ